MGLDSMDLVVREEVVKVVRERGVGITIDDF